MLNITEEHFEFIFMDHFRREIMRGLELRSGVNYRDASFDMALWLNGKQVNNLQAYDNYIRSNFVSHADLAAKSAEFMAKTLQALWLEQSKLHGRHHFRQEGGQMIEWGRQEPMSLIEGKS